MKIYDLRSDTVTKPSKEMLKAMNNAIVGDDVFAEDYSTNKLEDKVRELTGKDGSLFLPSGCMSNLISILVQGGKGKEILCSPTSHIMLHEIGSVSGIANTIPISVPEINGLIDETKLVDFIKGDDYYTATSAMIEIENTTNGVIYPIEKIQKISKIAKDNNIRVHIDGARIFNSVVETGISVSEYASYADSFTFCLSKGLGCPVGSVLSGDKEFIKEARMYRKMIGGGMRQIGYLAEAGIYALDNNIEKLKEDHEKAKMIKEALDRLPWAEVTRYGTNMIFFKIKNAPCLTVVQKLKDKGILALDEYNQIRFVTNLDVSFEDTLEIIKILENLEV